MSMDYINEAFKSLSLLNEEAFDTSLDGLNNLSDFMEQDDVEDVVKVIDPEAESTEDLSDSYIGKVIINCNVCHSHIFENKEDITIDDDGIVNVDMQCPYCGEQEGFTAVGEITEFKPQEEETEPKVEVNNSDEDSLSESLNKSLIESYVVKYGRGKTEEDKFNSLDDAIIHINNGMKNRDSETFILYNDKQEMIWLDYYRDRDYQGLGYTVSRQDDKSITFDKEKGLSMTPIKDNDDNLKSMIIKEAGKMGHINAAAKLAKFKFMEDKKNTSRIDFNNNTVYYNPDEQLNDAINKIVNELKSKQESLNGLNEAAEPKLDKNDRFVTGDDRHYLIATKLDFSPFNGEIVYKSFKNGTHEGTIEFEKDPKNPHDEEAIERWKKRDFNESFDGSADKQINNKLKTIINTYLKKYIGSPVKYSFAGNPTYAVEAIFKLKSGMNVADVTSEIEDIVDSVLISKGYRPACPTVPVVVQDFGTIGQVRIGFDIRDTKLFETPNTELNEEAGEVADDISTPDAKLKAYVKKLKLTPTDLKPKFSSGGKEVVTGAKGEINEPTTEALITESYEDTTGIMGTPGEIYTTGELRKIWEDNKYDDPSMISYKGDYNAWIKDTLAQMTKVIEESLTESVNNVNVETDDSIVNVHTEEDGKVVVSTEPKTSEGTTDEMIAPISDETISEIENNNTEEVPAEDELDMDFEEVDETSFDELGESYLKRVYNNIDSFNTTAISTTSNKMIIEGIIKFKSGTEKKTGFIFEAQDAHPNGKVRFIGENAQLSRGKKSFILSGKIVDKKLLPESFTYNYRAKNPEGKTEKLYGTINKK